MSIPRASFLGIPLELRQQIYALCLDKWVDHDPCSRRAIASVCRQTRSEAFPMLLHEHRSFTLEDLKSWTVNGKPDLLREITDVSLSDCALRYAGEGSYSHHISQDDASAITRPIFSSIPNLRRARFILYINDLGPTPGPTESQEDFLRIVAICCPTLADLNLVSDVLHVNAFQGFRNLHTLEWSGLSLSTPQETLAVLNSLPYLHTIKLTRWEAFDNRDTFSVPLAELRAYVSFTSHVLQNLKPLRQFQIQHRVLDHPSDFLTTEMVKALAAHRESLKSLSLMSEYLVEGTVLDQLLNLIPLLTLERQRISFSSVPRQYKETDIRDYVVPGVRLCHIQFHIRGGGGGTLHTNVRAGIWERLCERLWIN